MVICNCEHVANLKNLCYFLVFYTVVKLISTLRIITYCEQLKWSLTIAKWPLELKLVLPHCKIAKNNAGSLEFATRSILPMTIWVEVSVTTLKNSKESLQFAPFLAIIIQIAKNNAHF